MTSPADMIFENALLEREQARNQLRVALSALEEISRHEGLPAYVAAVARGALQSIQKLQDEADD